MTYLSNFMYVSSGSKLLTARILKYDLFVIGRNTTYANHNFQVTNQSIKQSIQKKKKEGQPKPFYFDRKCERRKQFESDQTNPNECLNPDMCVHDPHSLSSSSAFASHLHYFFFHVLLPKFPATDENRLYRYPPIKFSYRVFPARRKSIPITC